MVRLLPLLLVWQTICAGQDAARTSTGQSSGSELKQLTLEELSQVEVVTPSKAPVKAFQSPVAVYVITSDAIRRSGATTIPAALRLAPGVEVARIDASKWSIGIRGFGSRFSRGVLVMIDGRTVYTPLLAGTYWEAQDTMIEDIDRIEVIRGPGATIWGPNAVNGVINIITKSSRETHGTLASAGGGNEEQGFGAFRYGAGTGNLNYRFYGKAFTRGPEFHPDNQNFDDWRGAQTGFRADWDKDSRDSFTFQGDLYKIESGQSVDAVTYAPPYTQTVDSDADVSGGNFLSRWTRTINARNTVQVQAYFDRTARYEANFADLRNTFDVDFLHQIRVGSRQQVSWGLGARFSPANNIEVVSGLTFRPNRRTDELFTGFLQDEISLSGRLRLILGTKLLRTNFTGFEPEPSARLVWMPTDKHTLWTAFTHALRTPSDAEENFNLSGFIGITPGGVPSFARFNANPGFVPEQLNGYEAGYRRLFGQIASIDVALFYNHYHNLFDEEITGPVFLEDNPPPTHFLLPAQFGNGLLGTTKGGEVTTEWRPMSFWQLRAWYAYLQMDLQKSPTSLDVGTIPGLVGSSPRHEVSVQSGLDLPKHLQLDLTYRYISALPGQGVPSYSTADAQLAWRFGGGFQFAVVGRDLFQPHHPEFGGDGPLVDIKRSAYVKLTWIRHGK